MNLEKYKTQVGNFIRESRHNLGISQRKLITDEQGDTIISEKTLIEIEKGRKAPRPDTLSILLRRLGKTMADVLVLFDDDIEEMKREEFEARVSEISKLIDASKLAEAHASYKTLVAENWYNHEDAKVKQDLLFLKGALFFDLFDEPELGLAVLERSLKQTRPLIVQSDSGRFGLNSSYIESHALTETEYLLIINIIIHYFDTDEMLMVKDMCQTIIYSLNHNQVERHLRDDIMNHTYSLLSECLLLLGDFEGAMEIANQGIGLCVSNQSYKNLGIHHYNKGAAIYKNGDTKAAFACFHKAVAICEALDLNDQLATIIENAREDFSLTI